jgi:hypothetical protein
VYATATGGFVFELLIDDDSTLAPRPSAEEVALVHELGVDGIIALDRALLAGVTRRWSKVAMVIIQALENRGQFPPPSGAHVALALRRLMILVDSADLETVGDLRRPRRSEVRRPTS